MSARFKEIAGDSEATAEAAALSAWLRLNAEETELKRQLREADAALDATVLVRYLWGRRYLLRVFHADGSPRVVSRARTLDLHVRAGATRDDRAAVMDRWYREQLRQALPSLLTTWQRRLGVEVERVYLQRMKTKWGSCNPRLRNIRLNTDLARKPVECFEYILVHELAHLREPSHGPKFVAILDKALPHWRELRDTLNALPLSHADWSY